MTKLVIVTLAVAIALTIAVPTRASGGIYYVAKNGSNSYSCSQAQTASTPKLTINGGISCLSSGDTLVIKAGTYTDSLEAVNIPGGRSWSAPTVIKRFETDTVRIRPTSGNFVMSLETAQQHHIEFDGLIFDGTGGTTNSVVKITWAGAGPSNHAHHIRFRNSEIMSSGTMGRNGLLGDGDGLEVINSYFHDVDYGIYWGGKNALIEGTRFENGTGYAFHFYCDAGCDTSNAVVRNNLIKNFGKGPNCTAALLFANGTGHQAYNNEIVGQGGRCGGGIALYYSSGNTQIYNNTIHNNAGPCIGIDKGHFKAVVRDNICYQNGSKIIDNGSGTLLSNNVYK